MGTPGRVVLAVETPGRRAELTLAKLEERLDLTVHDRRSDATLEGQIVVEGDGPDLHALVDQALWDIDPDWPTYLAYVFHTRADVEKLLAYH